MSNFVSRLRILCEDLAYQRLLAEAAWDHSNIAQRLRTRTAFGGQPVALELGPAQQEYQ